MDAPYSYMFTNVYEIPEFDLASVANHAEMAKMMAPRPFMVERGHRDGVGVDEDGAITLSWSAPPQHLVAGQYQDVITVIVEARI